MIKLSKRLQTIANFIPDKVKIIDVGCDHGLLDIYIALNRKNCHIIASDINELALQQAKKNIEKYNLKAKIETRIGDGLKVINKGEVDTIVISGLGWQKIIEILSFDDQKLQGIKNIIIQSNTNLYQLRRHICALNYYITDEKIIFENNIYYVIINFKMGKVKYGHKDLLFGPILRNNPSKEYYGMLKLNYNQTIKILKKIPKKYLVKRYLLKRYLKKIAKEIKNKKTS